MDPKLFAGRYRLESQVARSSTAEVWLAEDVELERSVALKLLTPEADRTRFDREARAAASLAHPNVMRLYDYGEARGRLFMALEYLPGGTLEERLADGRPLPDEETAAIAAQLAAGLAHAHAQGVVHRDVKPANVLFDDEGRPKLGDFGIARITGADTITETGTIMGTAAYISPEQAAGDPAGPASDVYAFGVLLYRMLTGRLPFEGRSPLELADMHRRLDPPSIAVVRPEAPPDLAGVAMDALAKSPLERPADGAALTARLGESRIEDETGAAAAAPTLVIPPVHARRRRTPLLFAIVALGLLGAAGVVAAVLATRPNSTTPPAPRSASTARTNTTRPAVTRNPTTTSRPQTTTAQTTPATTQETTGGVTTTASSTAETATAQPTTIATTTTMPAPGG